MFSQTRSLRNALLAGATLSLLAIAGRATAAEIKLPAETARYAESSNSGYPLASTLCMTCHSADYVRMQPVMPRAFWKAAVTKMQKTFGAPIPDDAIEPITDYLVKTYGAERTAAPAKPATAPAPSR